MCCKWCKQARRLYLFFLVVICNLIKDSAKKHSNESAKTIRHSNQWPDNCTFFFSRNLIAMLLGPANGSTMVRHVLDIREGALPSNHTIPTLSLFPHFKYKLSKNKMLPVLQMV
jgi:hypothetical protein